MTAKFEERLPQVRVTPALKRALEAKAGRLGIRVNDAIRQAIVDYVSKRQPYEPANPRANDYANKLKRKPYERTIQEPDEYDQAA